MKILHVQSGELSGGAARGALALHTGLLKLGVQSKFLIQKTEVKDPHIIGLNNSAGAKIKQILRQRLEQIPLKLYKNRTNLIFSTGFVGQDITKLKEYAEADIIHFHWINDAMISIKSLERINKPIVWTLRDMWAFTGGCHLSLDCKKYETGCGACDQLKSSFKYDLSHQIINHKKRHFRNNLHFVALSSWMQETSKKSYLLKNYEIKKIHNGLDLEVFYPLNKEIARTFLNLPNKKIVLLAAQHINVAYKGFSKFIESLKFLNKDYFYVFLGNIDESTLPDIQYKSFGFLRDDITIRAIYSAADVFVAPSLQETFGKTLIEAMACGTPVVCFDATGPKDIVDHKVNGYKALPFESTDLANGISWVLGDEARFSELCKNARKRVEAHFNILDIAKQHIDLYEEIMSKKLENK